MQIRFNKKTKFNEDIVNYFKNAKVMLDIKDKISLDVTFVSKRKIKKLNGQFRNIDKVTDVLSFPSALEEGKSDMQVLDWDKAKQVSYDPETESVFLGDIVVCLAKAKKQAREFGHGIKREVCYLSVHGLLHLLGYDHMKENDKKIMRKLEEEILK